ncbi:MAG: hypothetical protein WA941_11615 [Nitrososphaeraceae archaeon]
MKQKIIAVVFLLAAATTGLSFALIAPLNSVNASSQQDCEAATSDCTVAEQRDYCREASK